MSMATTPTIEVWNIETGGLPINVSVKGGERNRGKHLDLRVVSLQTVTKVHSLVAVFH